ncbi:MAG TPA: MFS transporter [Baekduia sp.]|nr:MFS transporter [Baekduia sp.]
MNLPEATNWRAVAALAVSIFVVAIDMTMVSIALPTMRADFDASTTAIEWIVLGYTLPMVGLAIPIGRFIDQVAARHRMFVGGIVGFALVSVLIGFAPTLETAILGRVLQGAFGAVVTSIVPGMMLGVAAPSARGRALSVVATIGPLGAVSGPALGGHLVSLLSWHWIFFINVPVALVVIALARGQFVNALPRDVSGSRRWIGEAAILVIATAALLYALTKTAEQQWVLAAALALVAVVGVALWARVTEDRALVGMLRSRKTNTGPLALMAMGAVGGAAYILVPFILTGSLGVSTSTAGNVMLAFPAGIVLMGPLGGYLSDRVEALPVAFAGTLVALVGALLILGIDSGWSLAHVVVVLVVMGIGQGLFVGPNMNISMSSAPPEGLGAMGAMTTLGRNLGFSLGPAFATIVWHLSGNIESGFIVSIVAVVLAIGILATAVTSARRVPEPSLA